MELGNISQLKVYERALRNCSDNGNRQGVEMFGGLICQLAEMKLDNEFNRFEAVFFKDNLTERDKKRAQESRRKVEMYQKWIDCYSPEGERYKEIIDQAEKNSWKQS